MHLKKYYPVWPDKPSATEKELRNGIVCPNFCDGTIMSWDVDGHTFPRLTDATPNPNNVDRLVFSERDVVKARRNRHIRNRGGDWSGNETEHVFIARDAFTRISDFIRENSAITPLVGIYYGSYNMIMPTTEQKHPKQTTLILIPMKSEMGFIEPNICGYLDYIRELKLSKEALKTENHETLCPNQCNTGGD